MATEYRKCLNLFFFQLRTWIEGCAGAEYIDEGFTSFRNLSWSTGSKYRRNHFDIVQAPDKRSTWWILKPIDLVIKVVILNVRVEVSRFRLAFFRKAGVDESKRAALAVEQIYIYITCDNPKSGRKFNVQCSIYVQRSTSMFNIERYRLKSRR